MLPGAENQTTSMETLWIGSWSPAQDDGSRVQLQAGGVALAHEGLRPQQTGGRKEESHC